MRGFAYSPGLDGLRGFAVLLVVAFHAGRFAPGGFVGVDLFFVLSAFLIVSLLVEEFDRTGRVNLLAFYIRRARRLLPALALMLVAYLAFAPAIWPGQPHARDALLAVSYVSNYTIAFERVPFYLQHCWSLAVEEQFYLIAPLALPLLLRARNAAAICLALYVAVWAWRFSLPPEEAYYRGDAHCGGLLLGAAMAFGRPQVSKGLGFAGATLLAIAASGDFAAPNLPGLTAEIGSALLIASVYQHGIRIPLVSLGKLSYSVYLWHYPIAVAFREEVSAATAFAVTLIVSGFVAWLTFPIERFFMQWRRAKPVVSAP